MDHEEVLDFQRTFYPLVQEVLRELKAVQRLILPFDDTIQILDVLVVDTQLPRMEEPSPDLWLDKLTFVTVYFKQYKKEYTVVYQRSPRMGEPYYDWGDPKSRHLPLVMEENLPAFPEFKATYLSLRHVFAEYPCHRGTAQRHSFFIDLNDFQACIPEPGDGVWKKV